MCGRYRRIGTTDRDYRTIGGGDTDSGTARRPRCDPSIGNYGRNESTKSKYNGNTDSVLRTTGTVNCQYIGKHEGTLCDGRIEDTIYLFTGTVRPLFRNPVKKDSIRTTSPTV